GIFSTVSGDGKITVGEKAKVLEGSAAEPEIPVGSPSVVFHSYSGNDANDGLSAQAPKKSLGALTGAGALGVLRSGGTIVAVGKSYLGNSYTLPTLSAPVTFTSVYDGVDYKNAEPKENPACAFKMATGAVFTIKSDVVFDDIILFQENDQNTIKVTDGATLIVTDKAILMSNHDYHFKIELEKDTVAILSAEAIKRFTIEGEGEVIPYGAPAEAQGKTTVKLTIGQTTAYVNGKAETLDVAPVIENSRTLMPLRFIAEAMGAVVDWNAATATATLKTSDVELKITLGSTTAYVNGAAKTLDVPAASRNGRTLLPVRFIAESFGAAVDWDGATSTATLTK
ncbi:MAG: copper amine oxidase N-terminal domain-containing protein, partial [Clostridia bacterium]|nr:copper amine oxidase N-terminal domain-containing protein [Clostridia bacterium]